MKHLHQKKGHRAIHKLAEDLVKVELVLVKEVVSWLEAQDESEIINRELWLIRRPGLFTSMIKMLGSWTKRKHLHQRKGHRHRALHRLAEDLVEVELVLVNEVVSWMEAQDEREHYIEDFCSADWLVSFTSM